MITNPITAVETMIEGIKKSSRMFNEPTECECGQVHRWDCPKSINPNQPAIKQPINLDMIAKELGDAIEVVNTLTYELRRVENRLVILQSKLAGTEVGK